MFRHRWSCLLVERSQLYPTECRMCCVCSVEYHNLYLNNGILDHCVRLREQLASVRCNFVCVCCRMKNMGMADGTKVKEKKREFESLIPGKRIQINSQSAEYTHTHHLAYIPQCNDLNHSIQTLTYPHIFHRVVKSQPIKHCPLNHELRRMHLNDNENN